MTVRSQPGVDDATALLERPPPAPLPVVARVLGAPATPTSMALGARPITIGAGPQCDIVIDAAAVSRTHVELELVPEGVAVRDLGSRNGTFYLGQRIERMIAAPGSRLRLGAIELVLEPDLGVLEGGDSAATTYRGLLGTSAPMRRLFGMLGRLEGSLVTVLVTGESGVGKEVVARAIHDGSSVRAGPLVVRNCAILGRELAASELFGHKRGAFTGALESRVGAIEAAHGGTLFLDEVGELPLDVQPLLLRALEAGEITPVGSNETKRVKVRLLAATNRKLEEQVKEGTFREDLFYRLAVVRLHVPPLRERPEDVSILAELFASRLGITSLPPAVMARLARHTWPGNARELRNAMEAYAALGELPDGIDEIDLLGIALGRAVDLERPFLEQREEVAERFAKEYLTRLLREVGDNQSEAARRSGLERSYLRKLLAKHGLIGG